MIDLASREQGEGEVWARSLLAEGFNAIIHQHLVNEGDRHSLRARFLFAGQGVGDQARALVREGKIEQLGTIIEAQSVRLIKGGLPT